MGWIGVDLDGTLAEYKGDVSVIGEPLEPMLKRVKRWISQGKTVKIFTARAENPTQRAMITEWLKSVGLPTLEVTNTKDFQMIELWDDRAVEVQRNVGQPVNYLHHVE